MEFGIKLPNCGGIVYPTSFATIDSILKIAISAESLEYDSIWVHDHLTPSGLHGERRPKKPSFYDPLTTLTFLAAQTKRVMLGTGVIILPFRNPVVLAKETATLDILSRGRLILGVGVGRFRKEFEDMNIPFEQRGSITNEYIEAIKELWTHHISNFVGRYIKFSGIEFYPKPIQKPRPPIWIGGNSLAAIRRVARLGDAWLPTAVSPTEVENGTAKLIAYARDAERDPSKIKVAISLTLSIGRTLKEAEGNFVEVAHSHPRERCLIGSPEDILEKLEEYAQRGVEHFSLAFVSRNVDGFLKSMELFSHEVIPSLV